MELTGVWVRAGCGAAALFMAVFLFVGAETVADIPFFPAPFDKVVHFVYYGVMAVLIAHALGSRWCWMALVPVLLVGVTDEWHQSMVAGRDASAWDWLADVAGAAAFILVYRKWAVNTGL